MRMTIPPATEPPQCHAMRDHLTIAYTYANSCCLYHGIVRITPTLSSIVELKVTAIEYNKMSPFTELSGKDDLSLSVLGIIHVI